MAEKLPDINTHFADWYNDVVYKAELADHSPVRGAVVIRPYGWSLWEHIRDTLDTKIKKTGTQNAAFPLFIPMSFFEKEAKHVEGFSPELAVVTHAGGKKLEEPLVVRPTSETVIHYMFSKWIKSWRDLPLKINQWANVVRWEMRPRAFLRTTEFFWQEGHTAHATQDEAHDFAVHMLNEYFDLITNYLAIPAIKGVKSESEKFAGADKTYTIETLMRDGKALQMCTSHLLSQNFAKAFDMQFQDTEGKLAYPHLTSWGATTRFVGAVVMVHGDEKGLVLPPRVAPIQVVIIPILRGEQKDAVLTFVRDMATTLQAHGVRVHLDADEHKTPGAKFYEYELKGVPLRIEVGPRDIAKQEVILASRLGGKESVPMHDLSTTLLEKLDNFHNQLYTAADERLKSQWYKGEKLANFGKELEKIGGFWQTGYCGSSACEQQLKQYKATVRCILQDATFTTCFNCDTQSNNDVLVAKSY